MTKYVQKCLRNRTANKKNSSFQLKKWAKSQTNSVLFFTKYSIFILNVKSGRAGDEAKKRKSPAKSGRVGITVIGNQLVYS